MPDGTFTKVEFTPWLSTVWDANDTVLEANNAWYLSNSNGTVAQKRAARLSGAHAHTPAVVHYDGLGREVLAIVHNRTDGIDEKHVTYAKLDTEGKPMWIQDARMNRVMEYINTPGATSGYAPCYDIAGNLLFQHSMDAGERWMIMDSNGQPFYAWNENEKIVGTENVQENKVMKSVYDVFHRLIEARLKINDGDWQVIERIVYGETVMNAASKNLNGQAYQHYDSGGLTTTSPFDFKGNLLEAKRQLTSSFDQSIIDWNIQIPSAEIFTQRTQYDALNRMVFMENWHLEGRFPSTYRPTYNQRGVLQSEIHTVNGIATTAVLNIEYNAKDQRTRLQYGNGTTTRYYYDALTFRLVQLRTTRTSPGEILPNAPSELRDSNVLQNLYYTYDPSGNITEILDDAYEPVFFNNQRIEPLNRYTYDARYQLIKAEGRENGNLDQAPKHGQSGDMPYVSFPINDPLASRNYIQEYSYDAVGNILQMRHRAGIGSFAERWTRNYSYAPDSNRLLSTQTGSDDSSTINYSYDKHGSILNLGNVADEYKMQWDYRDMIHTINLGGGGHAFYNYDISKQRCRKRIERLSGMTEERIYLGGMELYRRWLGATLQEEIETHHMFVDNQRILITEHILTTNNNLLTTGIIYRYQYSNHLGFVGLECDGDGSIISYEEYHPFGTTAYQAKNAAITTTAKRYKYTGMERDEETGMAYHTARYYLPWLARWLSADPIGIGGGMNLFRYANSSPIVFVDLFGKQAYQKKFNKDIVEIILLSENTLLIDALLTRNTDGSYKMNTDPKTGFNAGHTSTEHGRISSNQELSIEQASTNQIDGVTTEQTKVKGTTPKASVEVPIGNGRTLPIERFTANELENKYPGIFGKTDLDKLPATTGWTETELGQQVEASKTKSIVPKTEAEERYKSKPVETSPTSVADSSSKNVKPASPTPTPDPPSSIGKTAAKVKGKGTPKVKGKGTPKGKGLPIALATVLVTGDPSSINPFAETTGAILNGKGWGSVATGLAKDLFYFTPPGLLYSAGKMGVGLGTAFHEETKSTSMAAGDWSRDLMAPIVGEDLATIGGGITASAAALGNLVLTAATGKTYDDWRKYFPW